VHAQDGAHHFLRGRALLVEIEKLARISGVSVIDLDCARETPPPFEISFSS
jgi:hypothetical protein